MLNNSNEDRGRGGRPPGRPPRVYSVRRLTIELPAELLDALDAIAGPGNRTAFIEQAIRAALADGGR